MPLYGVTVPRYGKDSLERSIWKKAFVKSVLIRYLKEESLLSVSSHDTLTLGGKLAFFNVEKKIGKGQFSEVYR